MDVKFLAIPFEIFRHIDLAWTLILLLVRFTSLMIVVPGLGMGMAGLMIRAPAIMVLSMTAMVSSPAGAVPAGVPELVLQVSSEALLGLALGLIPMMVVSGVQTAAHFASTTMGLQASQLIDPTLHASIPDLSRIYGDIVIVMFLITGGAAAVIHAASGLGGQIVPGSFIPTDHSVNLLIERGAQIFKIGVSISAPVVVALLLTNFVMGLITKAVPTVNIFIVSFPLTIGIGLILSMLVLPEMLIVTTKYFRTMDASMFTIFEDTRRIAPP